MILGRLALVGFLVLPLSCGSPAPRTASSKPPERQPTRTDAPPPPSAFRLTRPSPGPVSEPAYPVAEVEILPGGLTLMVVRRPAGVVTLSVVVRGGAALVPAGKSGLAALTARMLTEGTTKRSALRLAEAAESMGGVLEQGSGRDSMRLGITIEKRDLEAGLGLLAEVLHEPAFGRADLERVRKEWLDGIEAERQAPARLSSLVGLRLLLGPQRGAPVSGSRTDVRAIDRKDLVAYHRDHVTPGNTAVVVVGDVSLADVKPAVVQLFGGASPRARGAAAAASAAQPATSTEPQKAGRVVVLDRPGAVQSALFVAQPFPRRSEPGHEARELLNGLVGGLFTSRLNASLREKHAYTYGARSMNLATRAWGGFAVMTSVRTDVTGAALTVLLGELRAVRDAGGPRPVTAAEQQRASADLVQELGATLAHTADVASRVEELFVQELPPDHHQKTPLLMRAVTIDQVQAEALRLTPESMITVVVGDRSAVEPDLRARGFTVDLAPDSLAD